jgi:F0F1-type ATP synthase assembly protein I
MQEIKGQQKNGENKQNYGRWLGFGIEFAGVLAVFSYMGYKLDEQLNSSPWFLIAGFFVGFAGMFYIILKDTGIIGRK